jgi:hypothetical protein
MVYESVVSTEVSPVFDEIATVVIMYLKCTERQGKGHELVRDNFETVLGSPVPSTPVRQHIP